MPTFIVWSCGAVRADLIERVYVKEDGSAAIKIVSEISVSVVDVPAADAKKLLQQLSGELTA